MDWEWTHGPVVAGTFYPADPDVLRKTVAGVLAAAARLEVPGRLRGIVVPHAGYVYSGPVAATAYRVAADASYDHVVLVGPSHFERFDGVAALDATRWLTPLGPVALRAAPRLPGVVSLRSAYRREHSLEVQLPFLQVALGEVEATPLLTGLVEAAVVSDILAGLVDETSLLVVSTDLSHYEPYETARRLDRATADAVVSLETEGLAWGAACGLTGLRGATDLARRRGWSAMLLDLRNSGDTAGPRDQVVGYGAFALVES